MTQREKIGIGVIIALFVVLAIALWITIKPPSGGGGTFDNNVIIDQRVRNLNR